ncbi:capsid protein [Avian associated porprismacovirus]|uniref:Capsid protein n=1 Tax=Avian associated porprismacovirus TaxID=2604336 RepID=A0A5C0PVG6_9VIRU|nr:capsid protein [Avian associated porprismacovirus]QEJ80812.1 capsid protein [Avian associated porprismacovirus]
MATNYAHASYSEIYDFSTQSGKTTVMGIHTPQSKGALDADSVTPMSMLFGFFNQFRKFRYKGCRVTLVPAAQLPADPLQVGVEAGQAVIDPRDMLNPILFHGCHGESLQKALDSIYNKENDFSSNSVDAKIGSNDDFTALEYYSALTDNTWRKFGIQSPARLPFMSPRVWKTGTVNPFANDFGKLGGYDVFNAIDTQLKAAGQSGISSLGVVHDGVLFSPPLEFQVNSTPDAGSDIAYGINQFVSAGTMPLGWLPTTTFLDESSTPTSGASLFPRRVLEIPKVFMGILVFPPSYRQELYFRMNITHYFEFKDFRGISMGTGVGQPPVHDDLPSVSTAKSTSLEVEGLELVPTAMGVA